MLCCRSVFKPILYLTIKSECLKFREKLYEVYVIDKHVYNLEVKYLVSFVEVINIKTYSHQTNK